MPRARYLPANLPANPTYRKVNPADAPIMILGLTSDKYDRAKIYDAASTIIQQKLSQIEGVGQVSVGGGTLPSVRVEVNPAQLSSMGLTLQNVQSMLSLQNTHQPTGQISDDLVTADIITNDQISRADEYKPLVVGYHRGAAVRLSDVADVVDSTQNIRTAGYLNGRPRDRRHHLPRTGRQHHRDRRAHHSPVAVAEGLHSRRASTSPPSSTAPPPSAPP